MPNYPQRLLSLMLDTIFPKICVECSSFTSTRDFSCLCQKCFGKIKIKNNFECIGCKRKVHHGLTCSFCVGENQIDQLLVVADLKNPLVDKIIKAYKYKFITDMAKPLSVLSKRYIRHLLAKRLHIFNDNPLLVPVPLHKTRLNRRGFNQSQLLAKEISDVFHMSCIEILARSYNRKNQADIKPREERLNNVRNNFTVTDAKVTRGRTIILVDDICTTGATLNECARVLKENGAKKVIGLAIARGTTETWRWPSQDRSQKTWKLGKENRKDLSL